MVKNFRRMKFAEVLDGLYALLWMRSHGENCIILGSKFFGNEKGYVVETSTSQSPKEDPRRGFEYWRSDSMRIED